ncbi:glycosyltransferase family 2 protein [Patescibacteria group bacterium]|nr:glycosyltransferase family 2 protein [Patescibacteria group bacterium]
MSNILVSVIIPCRNEEKFISKCLDSIIAQDFPKDKQEVLIIDGMSEDKTKEIIENYSKRFPYVKLLNNPTKFTPAGLNIGVKKSKGEVIIRMDAHAIYSRDYISKCLKYLEKYRVDNVGGIIKTIPKENKIIAKAIAFSLSHPFGAGASYFRIGSEKPRLVDTVFGGCYRKKVFDKIGFFNENLVRSQDMEFNLRLKRTGGKILLAPDIKSYYYPKATLWSFFVHNLKDGVWSVYLLRFVKMPLSLRHYIPLVFVLSLVVTGLLGIFLSIFFWIFLGITCLYIITAVYFSIKSAIVKREISYFFALPLVFTTRHIGYGLGSILGFIKLFKK